MHIEQGTVLEARRRAGRAWSPASSRIWQYRITIEGQQDHAGGTTMAERRDAGLAAVRLLAWLDAEFPRHCGERTVWTAGRIALSPGAASIIPGRAEILFQFRDIDTEVLERLDGVLRRARAGEQPARALHGDARGGEPVPPGALRPRAAGGARRRRGHALAPGALAAHAVAARGTTRNTWPAACPRRCSSCPRSAASATTGRRTRASRTSRWGCACWPRGRGASWQAGGDRFPGPIYRRARFAWCVRRPSRETAVTSACGDRCVPVPSR